MNGSWVRLQVMAHRALLLCCFVAGCHLIGGASDIVFEEASTASGAGNAAPGGGGSGAEGGGTTTQGGGGTGAGGSPPCTFDSDCTDPNNARCDGSNCVPCNDSMQCEGIAGTEVCNIPEGECVECKLDEESACNTLQTCDLIEMECAGAGELTLNNCEPCTNDTQCVAGHRCIALDFPVGTEQGYYCLEEFTAGCQRPFQVLVNKPSIRGVPATDYCGIDEDNATCPAVNALLQGWVCDAGMTDGMCSPDGIAAEEPVTGALCRQVGGCANCCTYACGIATQCPAAAPANTCGGAAPMWCGG